QRRCRWRNRSLVSVARLLGIIGPMRRCTPLSTSIPELRQRHYDHKKVVSRSLAVLSLGNQRAVLLPTLACISLLSVLSCVTVEEKVASFGGPVVGKAFVMRRLVGGFAVVKLSESPQGSKNTGLGFLARD